MIVVQLLGGLGNQLFQYAIGRRLAYELSVPLKLDVSAFANDRLRQYQLGQFNVLEDFATAKDIWYFSGIGLSARILNALERRVGVSFRRLRVIRENNNLMDISTIGSSLYLEGYWQHESYFKSAESLIRQDFTFKFPQDETNQKMQNLIQGVNAVSVHIRRGDYVSNPVAQSVHGVLSLDYYHKAIKEIESQVNDPHFFIFSDDPQWVREHLQIAHPTTYVDHNNGRADHEDLRLLSLCQHHIIANSTFSWWGAWLSDHPQKLVYAPAKWFNQASLQNINILPSSWHRIPA